MIKKKVISSFSSLYQPERRSTWGDSPHYPRSSSSWVPPAPDRRKPPNKISYNTAPVKHISYNTAPAKHISYNTAPLKYLLTCRSPPGLGAGGTGQTVAGKKDYLRYFSFLKKICSLMLLVTKVHFYHIYTLANQCHWSAWWQILCVHRNHRRTFEKKDCVLSCLFPPTCTRHQFPRGHVQRELLFCKRTLPKICHLRNQWHQPTLYSNTGILVDNDMVKVQA